MGLFYRTVRMVTKMLFRSFYHLRVEGAQTFPPGGALIVANHLSFLDPPLVGITAPEEIHFLARDTLFDSFLFGKMIAALNSHPVAQGGNQKAVFTAAEKILREEKKLLIFPEGARSLDGTLQPLQQGAAFLAIRSHVPIIPVWIEGTYEAWPRGTKYPKLRGNIGCFFGSPIPQDFGVSLPKRERMEKLTQEIERRFLLLKAQHSQA